MLRTPCSPGVKDGRRQCCSAGVSMKGSISNFCVISCYVRNGICVTLRNSSISIASRIQGRKRTFETPYRSSDIKIQTHPRKNENVRKFQKKTPILRNLKYLEVSKFPKCRSVVGKIDSASALLCPLNQIVSRLNQIMLNAFVTGTC